MSPGTTRWAWAGLTAALTTMGALATAAASDGVVQGWSRDEQLRWYHGDQGSRLIPKTWLLALEEPDSAEKFFTPAKMEALGYLAPDADDPTGLPIGFSTNAAPDDAFKRTRLRWKTGQGPTEPWIGMNCAACHTGEIRNGGVRQRIEGGPGMGDFQTFIERLDLAITATLNTPEKFARFAAAVLGPDAVARDGARLHGELAKLDTWEKKVSGLNDPRRPGRDTLRYGHARLDAFGHIFNKVALVAAYDEPAGSPAQFSAPADAPVSYPFIWNIQQHDRVQWNGIAPNHHWKLPSGQVFDYGALGRNAGEVIGVFADVRLKPDPGLGGYVSSIRASELDAMETQLGRLLPPRWSDHFAAPASEEVKAGAALFATHCKACHADLKPADLTSPVTAVMTPIWGSPKAVGTDPWMACNAFTYRARTGALRGVKINYVAGPERFGEVADARQMLVAVTAGSLVGKKGEVATSFAKAMFGAPRVISRPTTALVGPEMSQKSPQERLSICQANATAELMAYKARPLTGIWATAPYLHNGSVRSLYELLLEPTKRAKHFPVGTRVLDPEHVGYIEDPEHPAPFTFNVVDSHDRPIPGNANGGHDYGNAGFSEADRRALVAYMKTL